MPERNAAVAEEQRAEGAVAGPNKAAEKWDAEAERVSGILLGCNLPLIRDTQTEVEQR